MPTNSDFVGTKITFGSLIPGIVELIALIILFIGFVICGAGIVMSIISSVRKDQESKNRGNSLARGKKLLRTGLISIAVAFALYVINNLLSNIYPPILNPFK